MAVLDTPTHRLQYDCGVSFMVIQGHHMTLCAQSHQGGRGNKGGHCWVVSGGLALL